MAIDFPNSPTVGQQISVAGSSWQWDGTAWNIVPQLAPALAQDTPPANPAIGQLWWRASNGIMYIWYDDGNTKQWVQTSPGPGALVKTARSKNRVVNPTGSLSQENGSTAVSVPGYPVDQWQLSCGGVTAVAAQATGFTSPDGAKTGILYSFTVAKPSLAAGDYSQIIEQIEGYDVADFQWGTVNAKPAVLRFNAQHDVPGTYCFSIHNGGADDRSFVGSFTFNAANVWQTFVFPIPGDTTGTWPKDNTAGMSIRFCQAVGSTYGGGVAGWQAGSKLGLPGMTNGAAVINKNLVVTDIGLYLDPDNTGLAPAWQPPDVVENMMKCLRYWRKGQYRAGAGTGTTAGVVVPLVPWMRTTPTGAYTDLVGTAGKMSIGGNNGYTPAGGAPVVTAQEAGLDLVSPVTIPNTWWGVSLTLNARM